MLRDSLHIPDLIPNLWFITGFVTRLKRRVSLVEQELLPFRSTRVHPRVRVTRSLVLYVCFVDHCLSFCLFSFGHCVVCSSIYGFWLPLWYLQTLLHIYKWTKYSDIIFKSFATCIKKQILYQLLSCTRV